MDRVLCAADASLTALYVMTSADMPKEVYIEDVIDRVVRMTRLQMQNTIFPEFDPVYRIDPKNKSKPNFSCMFALLVGDLLISSI